MMKSEHLSKRMSEGADIDPNSPEIVAELLDVSLEYLSTAVVTWGMDEYLRDR